jgi:hypothetical protein
MTVNVRVRPKAAAECARTALSRIPLTMLNMILGVNSSPVMTATSDRRLEPRL